MRTTRLWLARALLAALAVLVGAGLLDGVARRVLP
jgi:hypothetical protein